VVKTNAAQTPNSLLGVTQVLGDKKEHLLSIDQEGRPGCEMTRETDLQRSSNVE
jgi:hypothetical protein